ncbi:hypothetical protein [Castellaniella caeni]|uniref:hypothetical protein n=1 Tax=Castellaniella caeni TaxID=266123 RepID=UPI000C9F76AE|nr:hypothetical protein [Castellaniella caeni]
MAINGYFAQGLSSGLDGAVKAIFGADQAYQGAKMQGGLMGAQTAKFATDAAEGQRLSWLRSNPEFLRTLDAIYGAGTGAAFQAGGGADKFAGNSLDMQKYRFNDQVLSNIGDPGTDQAKINAGTSLLAGKAYTPYSAVGNTGAVLNQGTGDMAIANQALFGVHGEGTAAGRNQVVDTPSGVQIVNTRTGVASPAIGPNGTPVMGERAASAQKTARANAAAMTQARLSMTNAASGLDRMADLAQQLIDDPALSRITGLTGMLPNIPGGAAANTQARLESLKSQIGFAVLQAMRDASKTGGALGQVSDFENKMLQNNLAALDTKQSPEEFANQLKKIIDYARGAKQRMQDAYMQQYGQDVGGNAQALPVEPQASVQPQRTVVRRGTANGRQVVQYSDGSIEFVE